MESLVKEEDVTRNGNAFVADQYTTGRTAPKNRVGTMNLNLIHEAKNKGNRKVSTHLDAPLSQYSTPPLGLLSAGLLNLTGPEYDSWGELHDKG